MTAGAGARRRFDPRHRVAERLRQEFASRSDLAALSTRIDALQRSIDAVGERLEGLSQDSISHEQLNETRREIAVLRTGLRAVTNAVSEIDEDQARRK